MLKYEIKLQYKIKLSHSLNFVQFFFWYFIDIFVNKLQYNKI